MGRKKKQGNWNYIIIFLKTIQSSVQEQAWSGGDVG